MHGAMSRAQAATTPATTPTPSATTTSEQRPPTPHTASSTGRLPHTGAQDSEATDPGCTELRAAS
jgi:hypothetical protein